MRIQAVLFIAILFSCGAVAQEAQPANRQEQAAAYLQELVEENSIPGAQYVVVDSSHTIFEYAGGWADIAQRRSMTSDSPMMAYSMTKTLTAAAIMKLVDKGKLRLEDSANDYLKVNPYGKTITIRQLLAHTAGIPNPIPLRWVHSAATPWDQTDETAALEKQLSENAELDFTPGEDYAYSNIGYWLLGPIVESASGMRYEDFMKKKIFEPLGLSAQEMGFSLPDSGNATKGYLARWTLVNLFKYLLIDGNLVGEYEEGWLHIKSHYVNGPAFGGIVGTARGFATFLQDQLRSHSVLFGPETRRIFFEAQRTNSGEEIEMTPGWHIGETEDGRRYFFKEGGGGGFHSEMRIYPDRWIGTVIIVNETSSSAKEYLTDLDRFFIH
jgi:CubicO group peptidase (beta-lactamase class C family)